MVRGSIRDSSPWKTALTVLMAFDEAKKVGVEIPDRLVKRGTASILRQRKPDFSYFYGEYLVETGKPARGIQGLPFPAPDPADPAFPVMLMWNYVFEESYLQGTVKEKLAWLIISRRGLEKTLVLDQYAAPGAMDPVVFKNREPACYSKIVVHKVGFGVDPNACHRSARRRG